MRVLVTGAGGMLGHDVVTLAEGAVHDVVALTHADLDITDAAAVDRVFASVRPNAVINCAAWTDVDGAEQHEQEATAVNGEGARNLAAAAARLEAMVVYPSTDYVFNGRSPEPYRETDETDPLSAYGRSKLAGEAATMEANPRHFVVRTSWIFGPHGKNFVETMLGLGRERGQVLVVRDQVGCPTYTGHLAAGLVRLIDATAYGIHHMAGQGACSWYEFAQEIFRQAGIDCEVLSATTEMVPRPAPRPAHAVLLSMRETPIRLPPWQRGLGEYLKRRPAAAEAGQAMQ
ncbi:MAG: dTDP-4-dehydrorhamnose reductase [Solirubrobacterales bacterium]